MNHLTVDEIIEFVSSEELNNDSIELMKKVNGHIRQCQECMTLVQSFQIVSDELKTLCFDGELEKSSQNVKEQIEREFYARKKRNR